MIQFNKIIKQSYWTPILHLALVVLCLFTSPNAFSDTRTVKGSYKAVAGAQSAAGKVYVSATNVTEPTSIEWSSETNKEGLFIDTVHIYSTKTQTKKYIFAGEWVDSYLPENTQQTAYYYANDVLGSTFGGWWEGENRVSTEQLGYPHPITITTNNRTVVTLEAKWVEPLVTSLDKNIIDFGIIDNPTDNVDEQTVVFTVQDYLDERSFVHEITPSEFECNINNGAILEEPDKDIKGKYTIKVDYKPSGIHCIEGEGYIGYLTLSSVLYPDVVETDGFKTCTLKVKENYTPKFTAIYNSVDQRQSIGEVAVGSEIQTPSGFLVPTKLNYAAQAGAPVENANGARWYAEIKNEQVGFEGLFDVIDYENGNPIVVFNADANHPTFAELPVGQTITLNAEMHLSCTYYDKNRNAIPSVPENGNNITYLSVTVLKSEDARLEYSENTYDFGSISIGETPSSESIKLLRINIEETSIDWEWRNLMKDGEPITDMNIFEVKEYNRGNVTIAIKDENHVTCGSFSADLYVKGNSSIADKQIISTDAQRTLHLTADLALATPSLKAYPGDKAVHLVWNEVKGATKGYRIKYEYTLTGANAGTYTRNIPENNEDYLTSITSMTIDNLPENNVEYTFTLTAFSEDCSTPETVVAKATPVVEKITKDNAHATGIFTGTEIKTTGDGFPYHTKRIVDVSAAFKDGKPIFDKLYIFGLTKGNSDEVNETNATTPLYIYDKYNINETDCGYVLNKTDNNITVPNINIASKPTDVEDNNKVFLNIDATGQSVYFTGYCPYATTGGKNDNGVVEVSGDANDFINIYLDSLQLYAKAKDVTITLDDNAGLAAQGDENRYYPAGSGSAFVFKSTAKSQSTPFRVNMYIRGNNTLDASPGAKISVKTQVLKDSPIRYSSPIHIMPTAGQGYRQTTRLTMTDTWYTNTDHTYGVLVLQEKNKHSTSNISIDLGNESSTVIVNGGCYHCQNIFASYIATIYRMDNQSLIAYGLDGQSDDNYINYQTGGSVFINDGTFVGNSDQIYSVEKTTVDGGSFISELQARKVNTQSGGAFTSVDTKNSYGDVLGRFTKDIVPEYGEVEDNKISITNFPKLMDDLFPMASFKDGEYDRSLSYYYVNNRSYGSSSLRSNSTTSEDNGTVYLMLPKSDGTVSVPWAICSPTFVANIEGTEFSLGGGIANDYEVDYMLYTEIDDIVREAITEPGYKAGGLALVSSRGNDAKYSTVNRADNYTVNKKVYLMKPVVAGNWTMFVPPFDVSNVYVVEAYPDAQLRKDYGESIGYGDYIITSEENVEQARFAQAQRWMDLYTYWYYYAIGTQITEDFNNTGINTIVNSWVNYEKSRDKDGKEVSEENSPYTPTIEQLYHFTGYESQYPEGKNWWDANYYLYKSADKIWSASKETVNGEEKVIFATDWEMVTAQSAPHGNNVIMKRGEIYTMQFPATVGTDANDWNYWTGKYIIFEGVGDVQTDGTANTTGGVTVGGSNNISIPANIEYPNAHVMGNASFANITVEHENLFYLNGQNFNRAKGSVDEGGTPVLPNRTLAPMEGFFLANVDETTQSTTAEGQIVETQKIAKSIRMETGEVTYEIKTTIIGNDPGLGSGLPTIMNGMTLIVEPTTEGLTITPIKEQHVMLFDANGKMIFSKYLTAEENVTLPTGVYVVRGEYEQVKAIKK